MSTPPHEPRATSPADRPRRRRQPPQPVEQVELLSVVTLVLWLAALGMGVAGWFTTTSPLPPPPPPPAPPPVQAMNVELDNQPPQLAPPPPPLALPAPDQPPSPAAPPAMPTLAAAPSPAIAFAIPVPGAAVQTDAAHARLIGTASAQPLPPVRSVVYGRGEGRQPAPNYPPQAVADQQQGAVVVQYLIGAGGQVLSAQAVAPSPWPLLNDAAVRAVRDTWHFPPGPLRRYQTVIRFELRQL